MYFTSNFKALHVLVLATAAVVVFAASGSSYLNDPLLKKFAAESHGALKPVTNFRSRSRAPLTGPRGISLADFKHAPPRKNGAFLDATLIAMELSSHNWALGHILTPTGGVDTDKASVILSSPGYQDPDNANDVTFPPLLVNVQKQRGRGGGPWWIDAYDQAMTAGIQQGYGLFGRFNEREELIGMFTGSEVDHLGNSTIGRRWWKQMLLEASDNRFPSVVGTSAPEDYGNGVKPALLKYPHAYAVEHVAHGNTSVYKYDISTITLRDAETATKGVTYKFDDVMAQLHDLYWAVSDNGPGQNNPPP